MKLKILDSGSSGNCAILTDNVDNQLILDCGIKYEKIITNVDFDKSICCLVSHEHKDHSLSIEKIRNCGIGVYTHDNFVNGQMLTLNNVWKILPIELPHDKDTTSYSFLIYNKIENKTIYFATDCTQLPQLADKKYDLIMVENNYSVEIVEENSISGKLVNCGYLRHLSTEYVGQWLIRLSQKPQNLVITHLSNSGNISIPIIQNKLKPLCDNLYIAKKNMEIQI